MCISMQTRVRDLFTVRTREKIATREIWAGRSKRKAGVGKAGPRPPLAARPSLRLQVRLRASHAPTMDLE